MKRARQTGAVFDKRVAVLGTMHKKEVVIAPLIEGALGCTVIVPEQFDTDQFGTFTREVARPNNQLLTVREKAVAAMKLSGTDLALASEGSFGAHPSIPFVQSNLELVVLIDQKKGIEIVGHYRTSKVQAQAMKVDSVQQAVDTAISWGFPHQGVIVRQSQLGHHVLYKDVRTIEELEIVVGQIFQKWFVHSVTIETDMRAHRCPDRQRSIAAATEDVIRRATSLCPHCGAPGFVVSGIASYKPCRYCGLVTDVPHSHVYSCQVCHFRDTRADVAGNGADPGSCARCNP